MTKLRAQRITIVPMKQQGKTMATKTTKSTKPAEAESSSKAVLAKLDAARDYINAHIFERERETDGILCALLAGSSCLFVGAPGTGKTKQVRVATKLMGLTLFDILISETTKPDSIFGPVDIPALAKGIQRVKTEGYAPDAEIIFCDEIFKASGIVLNPMLGVLNEHQFRNGDDGVIKCPTMAVFAASNELPTDDSLDAIYDRFIMRFKVRPIRDQNNLKRMIMNRVSEDEVPTLLTRADVNKLRSYVKQVEISDDLIKMVFTLRELCARTLEIEISDRRLFKCFDLIRARAVINHRRTAKPEDLEILSAVFWRQLDQVTKCRNLVMDKANREANDLTVYAEIAESLYDDAMRSGDPAEAIERMTEMLDTTSKYTMAAARDTETVIKGFLSRLQDLTTQRAEFNILEVNDPTYGRYYQVNNATATMWTPKQIRSAGFKWFKKGSYWWGWDTASTKTAQLDANRAAAVEAIEKALGVKVTVSEIA